MVGVGDAVDQGLRAGMVWSAQREGSRVAARTVLKLGPLPGKGYAAVFYRSGGVESWCTIEAWLRWASKEQATFAPAGTAASRGGATPSSGAPGRHRWRPHPPGDARARSRVA